MKTKPYVAVGLSKQLRGCVVFARWCKEQGVDPTDAGQLLALADRAFKAGEREANTGKSADRQRKAFEDYAANLGYGCEWNGLGPTLRKADRDVHLPDA